MKLKTSLLLLLFFASGMQLNAMQPNHALASNVASDQSELLPTDIIKQTEQKIKEYTGGQNVRIGRQYVIALKALGEHDDFLDNQIATYQRYIDGIQECPPFYSPYGYDTSRFNTPETRTALIHQYMVDLRNLSRKIKELIPEETAAPTSTVKLGVLTASNIVTRSLPNSRTSSRRPSLMNTQSPIKPLVTNDEQAEPAPALRPQPRTIGQRAAWWATPVITMAAGAALIKAKFFSR